MLSHKLNLFILPPFSPHITSPLLDILWQFGLCEHASSLLGSLVSKSNQQIISHFTLKRWILIFNASLFSPFFERAACFVNSVMRMIDKRRQGNKYLYICSHVLKVAGEFSCWWDVRDKSSYTTSIENSLWFAKSYNYTIADIDRRFQLNWNIKHFFSGAFSAVWSQKTNKSAINWWAFHFFRSYFRFVFKVHRHVKMLFVVRNLRKKNAKILKQFGFWILPTEKRKVSFIHFCFRRTFLFLKRGSNREILYYCLAELELYRYVEIFEKISDWKWFNGQVFFEDSLLAPSSNEIVFSQFQERIFNFFSLKAGTFSIVHALDQKFSVFSLININQTSKRESRENSSLKTSHTATHDDSTEKINVTSLLLIQSIVYKSFLLTKCHLWWK